MSRSVCQLTSVAAPRIGFGEAHGTPLFYVNPSVDVTSINDFASSAQAALNEILDDAILTDGMSGTKAWLVQYLFGAIRSSTNAALEFAAGV